MTDRDMLALNQRKYTASAEVSRRAIAPETLSLVKSRVMDPSVLDEDGGEPFVWQAIISNNVRDFYHTRMARSTLDNFAADAAKGVSFLDSHGWMRLGLGYTFDSSLTVLNGAVDEFPEEKLVEVIVSAYTIPGYSVGGGITSDNFIRGVRASLIRDVSVGFYAPMYRCSICGENMWSWDCWHIPGVAYEEKGEDGLLLSRQVCFAWVEDGRLSEVSAVYDGANEDAGITSILPYVKAELVAEAGRMPARTRAFLESRYRHKLPVAPTAYEGVDLSTLSGGSMSKNAKGGVLVELGSKRGTELEEEIEDTTPTPDPATEEEETVDDTEGGEETELDDIVEDSPAAEVDAAGERAKAIVAELRSILADIPGAPPKQSILERAKWLKGDHARQSPLVQVGEAYRTDLVEATVAEGKRALGLHFNEKSVRKMLGNADIDDIKALRASFAKDGDSSFPGGRQTINTAQPGAGSIGEGETIPDVAYKG